MSRWFVEFSDAFKCTDVVFAVFAEVLHGIALCARLTHAHPAAACRIPGIVLEELTRRDA